MDKGINVLFVTTSFPRFNGDPAGIFIKKLVEGISKEVVAGVIIPSDKEKIQQDGNYHLFPVRYYIHNKEDLFYRGGGVPQLLKSPIKKIIKLTFFIVTMLINTLIIVKNYKIVHVQWLNNGIFAILPKILLKKKICITLRGSDIERYKKKRIDRIIGKFLLKKADAIITVNQEMQKELLKEFPIIEKKLKYIPNGVEIPKITEFLDGKSKNIFTILYVGNLVKEKGIYDLISVYKQIRNKNVKLVIIGSGDLYNEFLFFKKRDNLNIELKGTLPNEEVIIEMRKSDLLVLPSYNEGRPNVILEAMANKLPILATSLPSIKEIIKHKKTGLLFEPKDNINFALLLNNCIAGNEPLQQYAENAYNFLINENLTWEACFASHLKLYKKISSIN